MNKKQSRSQYNRIPVRAVIDEYLTDLRLRGLSPRTITSYQGTLLALVRAVAGEAEMRLGQLTPEVVRDYLTGRVNQETCYNGHRLRRVEPHRLSAYSLHHTCRNLRAFGSWLARAGYPNPFADVALPRLPKLLIQPLTAQEIERILNVWNPETYYGARWQALFSFLLDTGARLEEACTLLRENLDLPSYRARVNGKGAKERFVLFGNRTHRLLARYQALCEALPPSPYVFLSVDGERLTRNGVEHIVQNVRKKSGVARFHCHLTRHTFASNYATMHPNDVFGLQALLGHDSLDMTRRYVHLAQTAGSLSQRRSSLLDTLETDGALSFPRRRGQKRRVPGQAQELVDAGAVQP